MSISPVPSTVCATKEDQVVQQDPISPAAAAVTQEAEHVYPPKRKAIVILGSLYLSIFLVALDRLIIGIAIPTITNEFGSLDDVGVSDDTVGIFT